MQGCCQCQLVLCWPWLGLEAKALALQNHRPRPRGLALAWLGVTIPPLDPSARDEEESDYDEEAQIWAAAMEHAAEVEDEGTPDEYDWQVSRLVSAATYTAGPDAGRVSTGRMKIT